MYSSFFIYTKVNKQKKLLISEKLLPFGWKTGLEPATLGTTNRCSNQLSYNHHVAAFLNACANVIYLVVSTKIFFEKN